MIGSDVVQTWFRGTELVLFDGQTAVVAAPTRSQAQRLTVRFDQPISRALGATLGRRVTCRFCAPDDLLAGDDLEALVKALRGHAPFAKILAFGPHVDEQRLDKARAAGCDKVLTRGQLVRDLPGGSVVLINLAGRGDKDVQSVVEALR